jgi:aryl sulfotransferase
MSLWNHYTNHTDEAFSLFNNTPGRVGDEFPRPPEDIHEFWRNWMTRGWFEWESDGWPYWSHLYNVQSWFAFRELPNIHLAHFSDMIRDTEGEARRLAEFLEISVPERRWPEIVKSVSFSEMKQQGARYAPGGGELWKGGADTFLNKGTNGRWKNVLSDTEIALYDAACQRTLTPECRAWLEEGSRALA